jgi:hypothetical protein
LLKSGLVTVFASHPSVGFYLINVWLVVVGNVEKEIKFFPDAGKVAALTTGSPKRIQNSDVYYGFPEVEGVAYPLIRQNAWLRKRNGKFELKIVRASNRRGGLKISEEVPSREVETTLGDLVSEFDVGDVGLDHPCLEEVVYVKTDRRRYREEAQTDGIDEVNIDIDTVGFWQSSSQYRSRPESPDMEWRVGEIDITAEGREAAKHEIERVVNDHGLNVHKQRKVVRYFRETGNDVYQYVPDS